MTGSVRGSAGSSESDVSYVAKLFGNEARDSFGTLEKLYRSIYVEPPYLEDETDVAEFRASLERRQDQPNFRVVLAEDRGEPVGFALGHQLEPRTRWWGGALSPLPDDVTDEHPTRTFAVIELAVLPSHRGLGVARALHGMLTHDLRVERLTLLVRPDAIPAKSAYTSWGYETVGEIQPFAGGPVYDAMIRPVALRP